MSQRIQSTRLHQNISKSIDLFDSWAVNPWRRSSLYLIVLLVGFFLGSSIGMINGALALLDPIGALYTVLILEIMVRIRRKSFFNKKKSVIPKLIDILRIGLLYGLLMEGLKLL